METSDEEGISSRPMRLKVLYTFDAENKNNCLARWPHVLFVRTAFLDDATQIGIIDLKTCVQAVTSSSPELISQLGHDYTIYAHDYSEPDIPLVGQGLLSWALSSNIQEAEVDPDSSSFVTGVVTRSALGLFSRNAQETLEVKLRLTPVPNSTQNDYLNSLEKYKKASDVVGQDFDAQAWTNFVQNNPGFVHSAGRAQSSDRSASPMDRAGLESMQRMLSEGVTPRDMSSGLADPFTTRSGSRPPSRSTTPSLAQPFNAPPRQQAAHLSRPSSRGGMQPVSHQRRESFNSGYYSAEETFEEGPSRKRAKIMKVDWPTKSNLNIERQPESLRVAASTASSVRLHRPIAVSPALALQTGTSAEEPVRPPTPIPKSANPTNRRQRNNSSSLRRASRVQSSSPAPHLAPQQSQFGDAAMLSPEDTRHASISSSPANFPSSPPMMPHIGSRPTSPVLPPLPGEHDSGFMSGTLDDFFDDGNMIHFDDYLHYKDGENQGTGMGNHMAVPAHFIPVFEDGNDVEESVPPSLPPPPLPIHEPPAPTKPAFSRAQTSQPAPRVSMSSPKLAPAPIPRARQMEEEMRALSQLPPVAASDPVGRSLHRSNTWAGDMSDMPTSDAVMADETKRRPKKRVGKEQTKARLETAIAAGEMPPFCDNCGAIETPAWRRAFAKTFDCVFDEVETSLEDGAIVFKEAFEHNEDGSIKTFRGFKITKKPEDRDDEWMAITLCNPCGLWFHKQKCMRPPEKWNKGPKDPKEKRKRRARPRSERAAARKTSGGNNSRGDASTPSSDASTPQDTATEAAGPEEGENDYREGQISGQNDGADEPELPPLPRRATSAEPGAESIGSGLRAGLLNKTGQRAVQSSPARHHGSEAEPIELDLTPKPLRRQLFSPQNPNSAKSAATTSSSESSRPLASLPNFVRRSPRINKRKEGLGLEAHIDGTNNKENVTPGRGLDDGLNDLFDDGDDGVQLLPPTTPTPTRRSDRLLFKTPSKTPTRIPGVTLSPNVHVSLRKSIRHPAAAALLGTSKKVEDMTPFSKQIHQMLSDPHTHRLRSSPTGPISVPPRRTPRKASPRSTADFDFPDLPSLNNSSPIFQNQINFNFSELTTEQLHTDFQDGPSSDRPMPSSPPQGFFGFVDTHDDGMNGLWSEMDFGNSHTFLEEMRYPDPIASPKVTTVGAGLRRSPRNN